MNNIFELQHQANELYFLKEKFISNAKRYIYEIAKASGKRIFNVDIIVSDSGCRKIKSESIEVYETDIIVKSKDSEISLRFLDNSSIIEIYRYLVENFKN